MAENIVTEPFLQSEQGDAAFAKLMAAPVSAPRKRIRRAKIEVEPSVESTGKSLADIIRGRRKPFRSILSKPMPTYEQWLRKFTTPDEAKRESTRASAEWAISSRDPFAPLVAAREWEYLADCGRVEFVELAPVIPMPVRETVELLEAA